MSADIFDREWDVIVIGTGIGGGTIGRRLAEQGLSVLFVEKGPLVRRASSTTSGPILPTHLPVRSEASGQSR